MCKRVVAAVVVFMVIVTVTGCAAPRVDHRVVYKFEQLTALLSDAADDRVFIDLRDRDDYQASHIRGFINLGYRSDHRDVMHYLEANHLTEHQLVFICYSGNRSGQAFNSFVEAGYSRVVYVKFGFADYRSAMGTAGDFESGECPCGE